MFLITDLLRKSMTRFLIVLAFVAAANLFAGGRQNQFYVSPAGDDRWSGKLSIPNPAKTDGPFASLARARDAVRALRKAPTVEKGATVTIRAGVYPLRESLTLGSEDSGSTSGPIIWQCAVNESVLVTGSRNVGPFVRVTDRNVLARLSPGARESVYVTDLHAQGISDFGEIQPRGGPPMELFFKGERMTVARYPNEGWLRIADVPQTGDSLYHKGLEREKRFKGVPVGRHYGRITYTGTRPSMWKSASDIYLHGYWTFDWSDTYQRLGSVDTARKEFTLLPPHHNYGYTTNQRYYVLNVLEELDTPGEWYLDKEHGLLYFWPPSALADGDAVVSMLDRPLISLRDASWVRFDGLSFGYSRGKGIDIAEGHDVVVTRCRFHSLGREAVTIDGGSQNTVSSCDIHHVGLGGILLKGGDRRTLVPGHHAAINNHIHHYSTWLRCGPYAVVMDGVGQRIANNLIHHSPFEGVYIKGNDHIVEYNEFHHLMQETGDAGAIHTGRDWTWRGNVIRYNYFHDLQGPGLHGVMAVYLDDWACGFTVVGNLFYRAGRATLIGGGRDNVVENNIYVECSPSIHVDARGLGWASYYFDPSNHELWGKMDAVHYNEPPYNTRYPDLLSLADGEPALPKNNRITRNISYGGRWMDVYDFQSFDFSIVKVNDNIIGDPVVLRRRKDGEKGWDPYYLDIGLKEGYEALGRTDSLVQQLFRGNILVEGNPGVAAPERGDFRISAGAAKKIGFQPILRYKIGLKF
jgi:Right handed beta helix region